MSTTVAARIDRLNNDDSKTKAYATLTINDAFANPITKEASDAVRTCLVNAYNEAVEAQSELNDMLNLDIEEVPDEEEPLTRSM